jgi:DNA-binding CsgD family transcriptional regulator/pimeloyl-ACP methyl ester carboxylesterase
LPALEIRFCESADGTKIGYAVEGHGPPLLYVNRWAVSSIHFMEHPIAGGLLQRLAEHRTLVYYDRRGVGASQREVDDISREADLADLDAVVAAARLDRFDMIADHDGALVAAPWAARNPRRVKRLVLMRLYRDPTLVYDPAAMQQLADFIGTSWQLARLVMAGWALRGGPLEMVPWYSDAIEKITSPQIARRYIQRLPLDDPSDVLPEVRVPTLVLHWRPDENVGLDHARSAAALIPGSRIIVVDAPDPPWIGRDEMLAPILNFLNEGEKGRPDGLTARELEILALLAAGHSNHEIAQQLTISARTAERHIGNIYHKIGAKNRADATAYAYRNGISLDAPPK